MNVKLLYVILALLPVQINAQCSFDPIVDGDVIFCPNQTEGELSCDIQNADAYQWFKRPFSGGSEVAVTGATNFNLMVTDNDILYYFSVDVTIGGCTERSPEVLLDQWVFLLPVVEATGDFVFQGGTYLICEGESMFMTLLLPYDTNITWYRDGSPIADENDPTLEVTEPGSYTVSGAPAICPDYIQFLGVDLVVAYNPDPNVCDIMGVADNEASNALQMYPNPTTGIIRLRAGEAIDRVDIVNIWGQRLYHSGPHTSNTLVDLSGFSEGTYFLKVQVGETMITKKLLKD